MARADRPEESRNRLLERGRPSSLAPARDPSLIEPGAIVVAGDADASAVAEVVDIVERPAAPIVHLRVLPGAIEDYEALVRRAITPA